MNFDDAKHILLPPKETTMDELTTAKFINDLSRSNSQLTKPGRVMQLPDPAQREFAEANALWNAIEALNRLQEMSGRHTNFLRPSSLAVLNGAREVLDMEFRSPGKAEEIAAF